MLIVVLLFPCCMHDFLLLFHPQLTFSCNLCSCRLTVLLFSAVLWLTNACTAMLHRLLVVPFFHLWRFFILLFHGHVRNGEKVPQHWSHSLEVLFLKVPHHKLCCSIFPWLTGSLSPMQLFSLLFRHVDSCCGCFLLLLVPFIPPTSAWACRHRLVVFPFLPSACRILTNFLLFPPPAACTIAFPLFSQSWLLLHFSHCTLQQLRLARSPCNFWEIPFSLKATHICYIATFQKRGTARHHSTNTTL